MDNFDYKKYLVENKLTSNSRMLNEGINDISDAAVNLLMDKSKYMTKPGSDKGVYVVYDLSLPKGKGSFGDDNSTQKVGYWWTKDSVYKGNKFESDDEDTVKKLLALNEEEQVDELFGFGGAKATEKDSIRLDVRGGSIICKPIVGAGTSLKIEKNDSDFDHIRVGDVIRIVKSLNITAGKPFYLGTTEVIVDKLFLNGTETKSVTLPS